MRITRSHATQESISKIVFSKLRFIENAYPLPAHIQEFVYLPSTATSIVLNHTKTVVITSVCEIDYYFRILKYVCLNHGWGHFALNGDVLGSPPIHMWVEMQDGCSRHTSPGHISWPPRPEGTNPLRRNKGTVHHGFCSKKPITVYCTPKKTTGRYLPPSRGQISSWYFCFISSFI